MDFNLNNKGEIKEKKSIYEKENIFHIIKDGWDILSSEFDIIVNNVKSFNDSLDENRKKNFKLIISSLEKFKDNFKNVIFNISLTIGNTSSISPSKTKNEENLNLSVKNSYDNIYNEFLEIESLTKNIIQNQEKLEKNRYKHFEKIENKLQGYLDEINKFDYEKINQNYNIFDSSDDLDINEKINLILQKSNEVEKYNPLEFNYIDSGIDNINDEKEICEEYQVERIVLGYPRNMDDSEGFRCEDTLEFKKLLEKRVTIPIELMDERLTTVYADEILEESGVAKKNRKKVIDQIAAAIILQDYLDNRS